jgi:hypothetical protein
MPVCPNCGSQQPDGAAFCDDCGAKLGELVPAPPPAAAPSAAAPARPAPTKRAPTCPACGATVMPGEPFCKNCGVALGAATAAPVPPAAAAAAPAPAVVGALTCSNCGAQLEPGGNFCDSCGAPVSAAVPPVSVPTPAPAPSPAPTPVPSAAATPVGPVPQTAYPPVAAVQGRLVVQGTNATLPFPPGKTEAIVGREDPVSGVFPEIDLTDHGGDEGGVSRQHARIFVQGYQVFIEDLNSTNYTYVNQQRLVPGQPQPLNSGDQVRFGRVKLNYYA